MSLYLCCSCRIQIFSTPTFSRPLTWRTANRKTPIFWTTRKDLINFKTYEVLVKPLKEVKKCVVALQAIRCTWRLFWLHCVNLVRPMWSYGYQNCLNGTPQSNLSTVTNHVVEVLLNSIIKWRPWRRRITQRTGYLPPYRHSQRSLETGLTVFYQA